MCKPNDVCEFCKKLQRVLIRRLCCLRATLWSIFLIVLTIHVEQMYLVYLLTIDRPAYLTKITGTDESLIALDCSELTLYVLLISFFRMMAKPKA